MANRFDPLFALTGRFGSPRDAAGPLPGSTRKPDHPEISPVSYRFFPLPAAQTAAIILPSDAAVMKPRRTGFETLVRGTDAVKPRFGEVEVNAMVPEAREPREKRSEMRDCPYYSQNT